MSRYLSFPAPVAAVVFVFMCVSPKQGIDTIHEKITAKATSSMYTGVRIIRVNAKRNVKAFCLFVQGFSCVCASFDEGSWRRAMNWTTQSSPFDVNERKKWILQKKERKEYANEYNIFDVQKTEKVGKHHALTAIKKNKVESLAETFKTEI